MGLGDSTPIGKILRLLFPYAFFPRGPLPEELPNIPPEDRTKNVYPDLRPCDVAILDFNGSVRGITMSVEGEETGIADQSGVKRQKGESDTADNNEEQGEKEGEDENNNEEGGAAGKSVEAATMTGENGREPIIYWGQVAELVCRMIAKIYARTKIRTVIVVFDHIGKTPKIKQILYREKRYKDKPVRKIRRDGLMPGESIFGVDKRIRNNWDDIWADNQAKAELYEFLTWYISEYFVHNRFFPVGARCIIDGGYINGKFMDTPWCVSKMPQYDAETEGSGVPMKPEANDSEASAHQKAQFFNTERPPQYHIEIAPYKSHQGAAYFPSIEADISINSWILHFWEFNTLLISKDCDLLLTSLALTRDRIRCALQRDGNACPGRFYIKRIRSKKPDSIADVENPFSNVMPFHAQRSNVMPTNSNGRSLIEEEFGEEALAAEQAAEQQAKQAGVNKRGRGGRRVCQIETEYVDVNRLYADLYALFYKVQIAAFKDLKDDPIELFATLCFVRGCDYNKSLGGVTFDRLCRVYIENAQRIGPLFASEKMSRRAGCEEFHDGHRVIYYRVIYDHFSKFLSLAYRDRFKVSRTNVPDDDFEAVAHYIRTNNKQFNQHPPENLRAFVARLCWTVNYYLNGGKADFSIPTGLETDEEGVSIHGYYLNPMDNQPYRAEIVVDKCVY